MDLAAAERLRLARQPVEQGGTKSLGPHRHIRDEVIDGQDSPAIKHLHDAKPGDGADDAVNARRRDAKAVRYAHALDGGKILFLIEVWSKLAHDGPRRGDVGWLDFENDRFD